MQLSRARLLERALVATGGLSLGAAFGDRLPAAAAAAPSPAQDIRILNFLLLLEYLQEGFYSAAATSNALTGEVKTFAHLAGEHERAHVALLKRELGASARPRPKLRFGRATRSRRTFVAHALELEETTTAAFIGEAANLTARRVPTAARIVSVDARHAAWLRGIAGKLPAPRAADAASSAAQAAAFVKRTGFVAHG
jgi:hypothetical protein